MPKIILFAIALFIIVFAPAQNPVKKYVEEQAVSLQIDSLRGAQNDFDAVGKAIGDARIVLLGEQSHGDAATFMVKSQLIKYLHEKMGFQVLAFESDFFALNAGWDRTAKVKPTMDSFLFNNIFPVWTRCPTVADLLYRYIPASFQSKNPLQVSGFDLQLHGQFSQEYLSPLLDSFLKTAIPAGHQLNKERAIFTRLVNSVMLSYRARNTAACDSVFKAGKKLLKFLGKQYGEDHFWIRVIENCSLSAQNLKNYITKNYPAFYRRDEEMARNIEWLCRVKYKGQKIIIWAANAHIAKRSGDYFNYASKADRMMGNYLYDMDSIGRELYILGFTSYAGNVRWTTSTPVKPTMEIPAENSFENWINPGYRYAFTDFKLFRSKNPGYTEAFLMKGSTLGSHQNQLSKWTEIFDGVVFIREMYGCK